MAYSDYTLAAACEAFSLGVEQELDLFHAVPPVRISPLLSAILDEQIPLATSIHTEKARSELIVTPVLVEVRKLMGRRISLFSGADFNVDASRGLNGTCDFILAASPVQLFLQRPAVMIVEAKNDNVKSGLGQCVAEMVAARIFNQQEGDGPSIIHGAVTTGSIWRFLKLDGPTIFIDQPEYYLDRMEKILGILMQCVGGDPSMAGAAA